MAGEPTDYKARRKFKSPAHRRAVYFGDMLRHKPGSEPVPSASVPGRPPPETVLWVGTPSSWQIFWWWISIIGIPVAIVKHLLLKSTQITLTTQRLKIRTGYFSHSLEEIELYRVKDWTASEPFLQRLLGYGSVKVVSSDRTAPEVTFRWIKDASGFAETLRSAVEAVRDQKRVRTLEVDDPHDGDGHHENL